MYTYVCRQNKYYVQFSQIQSYFTKCCSSTKGTYSREVILETWLIRRWKRLNSLWENNLWSPKSENTRRKHDGPVFTTKYCSRARKVVRIVEKYWCRLRTDHTSIGTYIANRPILAYQPYQNLARKVVSDKLKKHQRKRNNTSTTIPNNRDNSKSSSNIKTIQQNLDIARLAGIRHNMDISLKVTFKKCGDHGCPLHGKMK